MNNYGATVKEFRKSKGLLLKELVVNNCRCLCYRNLKMAKRRFPCERFYRLLDKLK